MRVLHCICALLLLLAPALEAQQATPAAAVTGYTVFVRGTPVGREEVTVRSDATGHTITSQGRMVAPLNVQLRSSEMKYGPGWSPESFALDSTINGAEVQLRTTFANGTASTEGTQAGKPVSLESPVSARSIVLPNGLFAAFGFAALSQRLAAAAPAEDLRLFALPAAEFSGRVTSVHDERIQTGTRIFNVRRYELTLAVPSGDIGLNVTATEDGTLIRASIPAQGLDLVRDDVASATSRTQVYSNPGDEAVIIPLPGFNLGATITRPAADARPAGAPPARFPAVVLLSGSGVGDRDGTVLGIPTLAQLAGALADAGFIAVRYDKRGFGQSGGRAESATLSDYADDARAVVKWLADRKDVDKDRIALVGHSEGAAVAFIAASRENKVSAVVSLAGPATTGAELVLEQQQYALDQAKLPPEEREAKVAEQKRIQAAVLSGKGWEGIAPELKREADTPWFRSLLQYDPAKVLDDVDQPLLIVHGALDRQVPVEHADRLAEVVRTEGDSESVEVVIVRGVNHLLVPATTGDISEYATLEDRNVSKDVTSAVTGWLTRTFQAIK